MKNIRKYKDFEAQSTSNLINIMVWAFKKPLLPLLPLLPLFGKPSPWSLGRAPASQGKAGQKVVKEVKVVNVVKVVF